MTATKPTIYREQGTGNREQKIPNTQRSTPNTRHHAFTLIELLVVIALTAILLTLVFAPLVTTLNLTSRAGTQIEAQTNARDVMRQLEAELGGPVFVYDNVLQGPASQGGKLGDPDGRVNLWMYKRNGTNPIGGAPVVIPIRFGMIEYVAPASQSENSANTTLDPTTGRPDVGTGSPGNVSLPLVRGREIVRIFQGLQNNTSGTTGLTQDGVTLSGMPVDAKGNFHGYANRFDDAADVTASQDNRTTLYRAEVQPYIPDPTAPANTTRYVANIALFHTFNAQGTRGTDPTGTLIMDEPNFFYDTTPIPAAYVRLGAPGVDIAGRATVPMWECWKAVSQPLLPLTKGDVVELQRDNRNQIVYDANDVPIVRPLITFTPQYVENDPGVPASVEASASETPFTAATTYRSQYGAWARPFRVIVYRSPDGIQDPLGYQDAGGKPLYYEMDDVSTGIGFQGPSANLASSVGPQLNPDGSWKTNTTPQFAFTPDYDKGTINFAFPHTVYDRLSDGSPVPMYYNPNTINSQIDILANGEPLTGRRYLWLRYFDPTAQIGGTAANPTTAISPLDKFYVALDDPPQTPAKNQPKVRIVPGSERVFGPDQLPGAHYGYRTQYTRVSANAGQIGQNQYKILYENAANSNYVNDINDPRVQTGYIEFDSLPDKDPGALPNIGSVNLDATVENPSQAAGSLPVYRPHSLPLLKYVAATGQTVPADPIEVSYSFQMNRPSDVVKIDYLTRSIMNVNMEMRLYDPRSARPQTTQLTSKVSVRNLQR